MRKGANAPRETAQKLIQREKCLKRYTRAPIQCCTWHIQMNTPTCTSSSACAGFITLFTKWGDNVAIICQEPLDFLLIGSRHSGSYYLPHHHRTFKKVKDIFRCLLNREGLYVMRHNKQSLIRLFLVSTGSGTDSENQSQQKTCIAFPRA